MRFAVLLVLALCAGCDTGSDRSVDLAEAENVIQTKNRPPLELPKDIAGLESLGLKIAPDSVLAEGEEGLQIEDKPLSTTVRAKLYSPGSTTVVAELMAAGLKSPRSAGSDEEMRLTGKTQNGDSVDVMLGPASSKERTMILIYLTRDK
ncbi:MAG: hypothetical protein IT207_00620 [Fimbriimonadaceae bacterium]|nr:hypothetical protein [Fimbriimonadaceae bacterium]